MRTTLSLLGASAALVMCAVSGAMNYLFLSSLGKTPLEGQVLGAASAAADLLKAMLPFFIAWSWSARRFVVSVSGTIVFTFFAGFSFLSALGFAADNRGVLVETRDSLTATYQRMQGALRDAERKRAALPTYRPSSVVAEDLEGHKQDRRWSASTGCQNATLAESRAYCGQYFSLRAELAAAREEDRLVQIIAGLQLKAAELRDEGAGHDRDPQVSLLSRIFGQGEDKMRLFLIVVVALLVELGSSFGLFLATGHRVKAKMEEAATNSTLAVEVRTIGSVEDFCLEALVPLEHGTLSTEELFTAYRAWCDGRKVDALAFPAFATIFGSLSLIVGLQRHEGRIKSVGLARS